MKKDITIEERLDHKAKMDNALMRGLKVKEIGHRLALTDKGDLVLKLNLKQDWRGYKFYLDAIPVDEGQNKALLKLYFS